ncbi:Long-chain-fatty-acid--CoA ligase acsbg2 [Desmophyllum pertusum]|uniref:long-chain-fatty-acid--CoA ligase n=1 Tax=Desmophyllum pertusum TaxID=174260 RepID=A0A9X0CD02_9CNID|nr:Long-chain-fatty-acid--CoA ligase acsbg2 [Desmophyllum pertusum]
MAESDSVQRVDENGIKDAQPSDIVLDMKNEGTTKDVHIVNGSVHYTGEDLASNGEISQEKGAQQNGNGIGDHELTNGHQNGGAKSDALFGDEVIVKLAPAESAWTVEPDGAVELLLGTTESTSRTPITVVQGLQRAVRAAPNRTALAVKRNNEWVKWTYLEYYESVRAAAKSFIKLGLERYHGVGIVGFNSPEWLISDLGAIFAGGLAVGVYTTNSPEACHYVAENCEANIIVVENKHQLHKILKVWDKLPHLKAVVQYTGELEEGTPPNVYNWNDFMEVGKEVPDDALQDRINELAPNKCCTLIYTSGTTGNPKGVMLSHDNLLWTAEAAARFVNAGEKSIEQVVSYLPLSHIAAQEIDIFLPLYLAGSVWFAQADALKGTLVQTLREVRPTLLFGVPRVYEKIMEKLKEIGQSVTGMKRKIGNWAKGVALQGNRNLEQGRSVPFGWTVANGLVLKKIRAALGLDRCRLAFVGAAPVTMETLRYFQSINIPLYELFGMSECSGPMTVSIPGHVVSGSCGIAMDGCEMKVINQDEEGNGELCFKGRHVFMGYLKNEEKTNEALDTEGWLHSGDIGKIDQNGQLYITGRIKELIITAGGENIAPVPIEDGIKEEVSIISNAMALGDKRKFLSCFITLKVVVDLETGEPSDQLTDAAIDFCKSVGSEATTVSEILSTKDEKVMTAIQEGIDRANAKSVSRAQKVQKWIILEKDFSIPGGELGPTLKLRRPIVSKMFKDKIDAFYEEA